MLSYNELVSWCASLASDRVVRRPLLLVVDDSDVVRELLRSALCRNFEVVAAAGVGEALDVLRTRRVDIVLTDLGMADDNGLSLFDHVSERYPHIPVVFMTGHTEGELHKGAWARTSHVVAKPFRMEGLVATLRAASAAHHQRRTGTTTLPSRTSSFSTSM